MSLPSLIQGGAQFFQGRKDIKEAERIKEQGGPRPDYEIPESVGKMVSMYQQLAQGGMPGEDTLKEDIQASTARTAGTAAQLSDSPVGALTALGGAQQRELGALRDLQVRAAQYQTQQRQNLAQAYGQQAQWEDQAWNWNEGRRWQEAQNEYWNMRQSGQANMWGGLDSAMSGVQQGIGAGMQTQMFNQMYPKMGGAAATGGATSLGAMVQQGSQFGARNAFDLNSYPMDQIDPFVNYNQGAVDAAVGNYRMGQRGGAY